MTSKLTRERLQELAEGQSGSNLRTATHEESQELARMALAAMDSEPVAWRYFKATPSDGGYWILRDYKPNCSGVEPLYRHAQQPVVPDGYVMVPKEPTEEMLQASYREAAVYSPTAYRAMIAATPQEVKK